jgi:aminopeptidase N
VSDIRYGLQLSLERGSHSVHGSEVLTFHLTDTSVDLPLDFRDGALEQVLINGHAAPTELSEGHIILLAPLLRLGENTVSTRFTARAESAGAAITRYEDKEDGSEYLYSLFVPMDASMAFPCFDQPDLKARFTLTVNAPTDWTIIGNTAPLRKTSSGTVSQTAFSETKPISTYLFAFAAGPWASVHHTKGLPDVYVRRSQVKRAEPEVARRLLPSAISVSQIRHGAHPRVSVRRHGARGGNISARGCDPFPPGAHRRRSLQPRHHNPARTHSSVVR